MSVKTEFKRKNSDLVFRTATPEDLEDIQAITQKTFGDHEFVFSIENLEDWYNHNEDMCYVVKDVKKDINTAVAILLPVTGKLYDRLRKGEVGDMCHFDKNEVRSSLDSQHYYVELLCINPEIDKSQALLSGAVLAGGISRIIYENGGVRSAATGSATEGLNMLEKIGYKPLAVYKEEYPIFDIRATPQIARLLSRAAGFEKLLKRNKRKRTSSFITDSSVPTGYEKSLGLNDFILDSTTNPELTGRAARSRTNPKA